MAEHDLAVSGGTVVTATDVFAADIGISNGRTATVGSGPGGASLDRARRIDTTGLLVMPGGIDTHCHSEQLQQNGGAILVISFSTQFMGGQVAMRDGVLPDGFDASAFA
jgi:dihydropyrimidinase